MSKKRMAALLIMTVTMFLWVSTTVFADSPISTGNEVPRTGMNRAVLSTEQIDGADVSLMAVFQPSSVTQVNNISFPLAEYPANIYDIYDNREVKNGTYFKPLSWFHVNGLEGCSGSNCKIYSGTGECEGFARYAHDVYMHTVDNDISFEDWLTSKHPGGKITFNSNIDVIKDFFMDLNTGAVYPLWKL